MKFQRKKSYLEVIYTVSLDWCIQTQKTTGETYASCTSPFTHFFSFCQVASLSKQKTYTTTVNSTQFQWEKNTKNDRESFKKQREGDGVHINKPLEKQQKNNSFINSNRTKNYESNKKKHFKDKTNPLELKYHETVAVTYQKRDSFLSSPYVHVEKTCGARCGVLLNSFFCKQTLERRTFENIGCVSKNKPRCAVRGVVA